MCRRTVQNTINAILGTSPYPLLGSSPRRRSFILSPLADPTQVSIGLMLFGAGANQKWTTPVGNPTSGVTQILDIYCWGSGGNAGASGVALGGGGGGGGGFSQGGSQSLVSGSINTITVDAAGGGATSSFTSAINQVLAKANSGVTAVLDAAGAGGSVAGATGVQKFAGGAGAAATGGGGAGGGGGGAGGTFAAGAGGTVSNGGAGGGAATQLGFGAGGAGGNGNATTGPGGNGVGPGGGGGGAGTTGAPTGNGADGLIAVFYRLPPAQAAISLSHRSDVIAGQGILNFIPGATFPTIIGDDQIGSIIQDEWWAVSGVAGVPIQITEYLYADDDESY